MYVCNALFEASDDVIELDIIVPSYSEWSTSVVMARKVGGGYRLCIDFRKVH